MPPWSAAWNRRAELNVALGMNVSRVPGCRAAIAALVAAVLAGSLAACGSSAGAPGDSSSPPAAPRQLYSGCTATDPGLTDRTLLARADLDGDGDREAVSYVGSTTAGCGTTVLVDLPGGLVGAATRQPLDTSTARVVPHEGGDLLYVESLGNPRGGFQPHLYAFDGSDLGEVLDVHGNPPLDFVATDGGGLPQTATCRGGFTVFSASMHHPAGVVIGWDVHRTSYTLEGLTAVAHGGRTVRSAVADPLLRRQLPQLFDPHGSFRDCTA